MTPEEELAKLIAEQERDDKSFRVFSGCLSLDAPFGDEDQTLYDALTEIEPGIAAMPSGKRLEVFEIQHGSAGAYNNDECRCAACRRAKADLARDYYRLNRTKILARKKTYWANLSREQKDRMNARRRKAAA